MGYASAAPQLWQTLLSRWRLILSIMIVSLATTIVVTYLLPVTFTADVTLIINFNEPADFEDNNENLSPILEPNYMATQVGIIESHHVALRVVDNLKLADNADWRTQFIDETDGIGDIRHWLADILLEDLTVAPDEESRLVTVSFTAKEPQFAAAVANAFATEYENTNLELSTNAPRKSAEQFSGVLADLRAKIDQAQSKLSQHQRSNNIFAIDEKLDIETARLNELNNNLLAAQGNTRVAESQLRQIEDLQRSGSSLDGLPQLLSNSFVQQLKTDLGRKQAELAQISSRAGTRHPQYQSLSAEVQTLRSSLARETKAVVISIKNQVEQGRGLEQSLMEAVDRQKTKEMELKKLRDQVPALTREVEGAQYNYQNALTEFNKALVQSRVNQTNVTILNPARVPMIPSFPDWAINIALSIVLGGTVALVTVLMLEAGGSYKGAGEKAVSRAERVQASPY